MAWKSQKNIQKLDLIADKRYNRSRMDNIEHHNSRESPQPVAAISGSLMKSSLLTWLTHNSRPLETELRLKSP